MGDPTHHITVKSQQEAKVFCTDYPATELNMSNVVLGKGGFGVLKEAKLTVEGRTISVAAKRIADEKFFVRELDMLQRVHQIPGAANLFVGLVGQCHEQSLLLLELMPCGDLERLLP